MATGSASDLFYYSAFAAVCSSWFLGALSSTLFVFLSIGNCLQVPGLEDPSLVILSNNNPRQGAVQFSLILFTLGNGVKLSITISYPLLNFI